MGDNKKPGRYRTSYVDGDGITRGANAIIEYKNHRNAPQDTIVYLTPDISGQTRKGTFSGKNFKVEKFENADGTWYPLEDYNAYWDPRMRQAYRNAQYNPGLFEQIGNWLKGFVGLNQQGGTINKEQEELQYAMLGYITATKKQPKDEKELMQIAQALMQLKQKDPEQYTQLVQLGMQQNAVKAKYGAKLDYVKRLKGKCPEGQELKQKGGKMLCAPCMAKCGKKLKKKK